ncbi:putative restriction endonuclease [Streptomyces sp. CG 926]|uniref:Uma2 family endonuclease n=1 Tax=Streptomyces sp. CG 926 TaxID=1882405 RepID=UPI000D6B0311|nr:Uma2 family endonuclease [Streptomyces sp. CG 926]PWK70332.1 putative restriction endonuclease [Streptomyces sp. CG 926]
MAAELPEWMLPPRPSGWEADDLDHWPQAPRHTELIDGALIFMMSPQRSWHSRLVENLTFALRQATPDGIEIEREMTIRLDRKSRPEPDILAASVPYDPDRTRYLPDEVVLVIEVVSEESADRDRSIKPFKYAQAEIPHFWRVEDEEGEPVVHVYELDTVTRTYVPTGIHRERLKVAVPFPADIDLGGLVP